MKSEIIKEVVTSLVGRIDPVGDAALDRVRQENLENYVSVFLSMYQDIKYIANTHADSKLGSVVPFAKVAKETINEIIEEYAVKEDKDKKEKDRLTASYLKGMFDLSDEKAEDFLNFCKEHTIIYRECFGRGEIMYPAWKIARGSK